MRQKARRSVVGLLGAFAVGWPAATAPGAPAGDAPEPSSVSREAVSDPASDPSSDPGWLARVQQGLAEREYWASRNGEGLQAPNRAHDLRTYFDGTGIRVADRTKPGSPTLVELRLVGWGRGETLAPVGPGEVTSEGARVEIARPGLVEWYVNAPSGLEQGFTLEHRPEGEGPLLLTLAVTRSEASVHGGAVTFRTATGRRLEYGHLVATDATGRSWPARLEVPAPNAVRIRVDEGGAVYPLTVDPLLTATADTQLESDQAGARLGLSVAGAGDVNGDGYADVIVGADQYDAGQTTEGAAFVFLGSASGIASGSAATAAAQLESDQANAQLGISVAGAGDVNGDGYADVIVGSRLYDAGQTDEGAAFVFLGSASGIASGSPATAAAQLESDQGGAFMGYRVAGAGDTNGDGYADVIVSARNYDAGQTDEGAAFVFLGSASGIVGTNPATAQAQLESDQADAILFTVAGAGDVNGDGFADVIVGAYLYDAGQADEGAAFVFLGSASGIASGSPATAGAQLESDQAAAWLGVNVAGAGDVNGDGYADVIVGAVQYDAGQTDEGAAFVFLGSASGVASGSPATAAAQLESDQADAWMGGSVAGAGDVNGDGYADVIVGAVAYDAGESDEGAAFVFLGSASGVASGSPATAAAQLESDQADAFLGQSVSGAGDVDGDGYADVIVGAYGYDGGQLDEGAAFVYHGGAEGIVSGNPSTAAAQLEPDQAMAEMGWSVAGAGDVNGDGLADVIVGARRYDAGQTDEGAAFVFLGSASGIAGGGPGSADAQLESNQESAELGFSVAGAGDVNGDGYADVIVGAYLYEAGEAREGAAWVFLGSASGIASGNPATAATQIESDQVDGFLGSGVAGAGDVNGDGYADVIVGAHAYDAGQSQEGAAFVFLGSASGIASGSPATAAAQIESDQAGATLGESVAGAGDVDGDGYADVIVGAEAYDAGQSNEGAAFVFLGGPAGVASGGPSAAHAQLEGNQVLAGFGTSVAGAGDVNGDGYADVIVGAHTFNDGADNEGSAFVFLGSASGIASGGPETAAAWLQADEVNAEMGMSVAGAGDVNGDGYADVIVGAHRYGPNQEGAAFIFLGSASGIASGNPTTAAAQIEGDQGAGLLSWSVAGAGDVNGDGYADVIVGARWYNAGQVQEGAAFVFYGGGGVTGRLVAPLQWRGGGDLTLVQPGGVSQDEDDFQVTMFAGHPEGRGLVRLEVEACPNAVPFDDPSCSLHLYPAWADVTAIPEGPPLTMSVSGLVASTLYRWRARVLYAPFSVVQPGITPPPNPAHGPWRRFQGQAFEADLRTGLAGDTDADGLSNDDEINIYGTDPTNPDTDGDGLNDGAEVALGTNPLDEDTDGDFVCDGGIQVGTCSAPGPDNCPFITNGGQANSDGLSAGDACQCGDVNTDFVVDATDVQLVREHLMDVTPLSGPFDPTRCNVIGLQDAGDTDCGVDDVKVLQRVLVGDVLPDPAGNACAAYFGP